jgi:Ca-activated chloride channel homolog
VTRSLCAGLVAVLCCWLAAGSAAAELPSFLRTENGRVRDGNEALSKGDAKGALEAYNRAARELPEAPGVQLNRGLSLLKQGELGKAREALLAATQPGAPNDLRADAYQDLALAFYREGDQLAGENKHAEAQKMFREALDASKRSLRLRPNDPNTAWNLELAARRVREEEQKQKEEEEKKKEEQKDQKQDQDQQDQQSQDQQNQQDQDQQDQNKQDQDKQDPQKQDPQGDQQKKQDPQSGDQKDQQKKPEPKPEQKPQDRQPAEPKPDEAAPPEQALPPEAAQALDSLEGSEENFERHRARQRASRERRAPEKDW